MPVYVACKVPSTSTITMTSARLCFYCIVIRTTHILILTLTRFCLVFRLTPTPTPYTLDGSVDPLRPPARCDVTRAVPRPRAGEGEQGVLWCVYELIVLPYR